MNVLFVCVANSGRSVMAERLFRAAAGGRHQTRSAGSDPGTAPHPHVVEALGELGIDASDHVPRKLDAEAQAVVTRSALLRPEARILDLSCATSCASISA